MDRKRGMEVLGHELFEFGVDYSGVIHFEVSISYNLGCPPSQDAIVANEGLGGWDSLLKM